MRDANLCSAEDGKSYMGFLRAISRRMGNATYSWSPNVHSRHTSQKGKCAYRQGIGRDGSRQIVHMMTCGNIGLTDYSQFDPA
jgi:hypothetical protein